MLALFPRMKEDELLYSALSRYAHLMAYPREGAAFRAVYGPRVRLMRMDLPTHVNAFADSIIVGPPDVETLIARHTLYPYILSFAPVALRDQVLRQMVTGHRDAPPAIGIGSYLVPPHSNMMLCPRCAAADIRAGTPACWFRAHQLPGVLVCPRHMVALRRSPVPARGPISLVALTPELIAASSPLVIPSQCRSDIEWLARQSAKLLLSSWHHVEPANLALRLQRIIQDRLDLGAPSLTYAERLGAALLNHESIRRLASALNVEWTVSQLWLALRRIRETDRAPKHPLLVLLLLRLVGASVDDLLEPTIDPDSDRGGRASSRRIEGWRDQAEPPI